MNGIVGNGFVVGFLRLARSVGPFWYRWAVLAGQRSPNAVPLCSLADRRWASKRRSRRNNGRDPSILRLPSLSLSPSASHFILFVFFFCCSLHRVCRKCGRTVFGRFAGGNAVVRGFRDGSEVVRRFRSVRCVFRENWTSRRSLSGDIFLIGRRSQNGVRIGTGEPEN